MSFPQSPPEHPHVRRVRRHARLTSALAAPLVGLGVVCWALFNLVVCGGERSSAFELWLCRFGQVVVDVPAGLLAFEIGWLLFSLALVGEAYAESVGDRQNRFVRGARHAYHGYGRLDDRHRSIVFFAAEMSAWAAALVVVTLVYYHLEMSAPVGVFVIAVVARLVWALGRMLMRTRGTPQPGPSSPDRPRPSSRRDGEGGRTPVVAKAGHGGTGLS